MASADFKLTKENTEILKSFPDFGAGDTINVHISRSKREIKKGFSSFRVPFYKEKILEQMVRHLH